MRKSPLEEVQAAIGSNIRAAREALGTSVSDPDELPNLYKLLGRLGAVPVEASLLVARHYLRQGDALKASSILDAIELLQPLDPDALQLRIETADAVGDRDGGVRARLRLAANNDAEEPPSWVKPAQA